jgi:hypothetical protein
MFGLDLLLDKQEVAFLLDKYTITVSLLTLGPFLVRGMTFRGERAAPQSDPSPPAVREVTPDW